MSVSEHRCFTNILPILPLYFWGMVECLMITSLQKCIAECQWKTLNEKRSIFDEAVKLWIAVPNFCNRPIDESDNKWRWRRAGRGFVHHRNVFCRYRLLQLGGSQKATLVVLLVVMNSLKISKAFLIRSGAQWNFAYTFMRTFPTDSTVSDFKTNF